MTYQISISFSLTLLIILLAIVAGALGWVGRGLYERRDKDGTGTTSGEIPGDDLQSVGGGADDR